VSIPECFSATSPAVKILEISQIVQLKAISTILPPLTTHEHGFLKPHPTVHLGSNLKLI
jgi:hypothetical protein